GAGADATGWVCGGGGATGGAAGAAVSGAVTTCLQFGHRTRLPSRFSPTPIRLPQNAQGNVTVCIEGLPRRGESGRWYADILARGPGNATAHPGGGAEIGRAHV